MSESVAKALRAGIDGEKKRGISTILFVRLGAIGAFATDSDNLRRRGPREGCRGVGRRPRRVLPDVERCISHSRVQFQPLFSRAKCTSRVRSARFGVGRRASRPASTSLNPRARHLTLEHVT